MLIKAIQSPFGATLGFHVPMRIEGNVFDQSGHLAVWVHSWPAEADFIEHGGKGFTYAWPIAVPVSMITGTNLQGSIEVALAGNAIDGSPFFGASIVSATSDLDAARERRWALIKQTRELASTAPITWDSSTFDADESSQALISGAINGLARGDMTSVDWTLADNSVRTLTLIELQAVGLAVFQRTSANYEIARALRVQIFDPALTTVAEIEAIRWPTN